MSSRNTIEHELGVLGELATAGYLLALHIRFAAPLVKFQTYNQDWIDHYTAQAYQLRDPMVAWGFTREGVTRWSALGIPDTFGIMKEAAEFGMPFGACVSCGPIASRTIAGFARYDREFADHELSTLEDVTLRLHDMTEPPESLTQAQKDALRLIAAGDRHAAAAAKLGISESALKARLTSARQRLMARTTAEALQRAQEYRLL
ncbi:MAG: autoinducer binding domain-containing protein [Pseudomonadota bacterium]